MKKLIVMLVLLGIIISSAYAYCGDGIYEYPEEQCDDGNNEDGDTCSATCQKECYDTDDPDEVMEFPPRPGSFGYNPSEKGTVTYYLNGPYPDEDFCHPSPGSEHILQEKICMIGNNGWTVGTVPYPCEFGCQDGACLDEPQNQIPEFTIVGAVVVLGLAGLFIFRRRN